MDDNEVNKIIAEFMDLMDAEICHSHIINRITYETYSVLYTKSLDALVPVWEKLEMVRQGCRVDDISLCYWIVIESKTLKGCVDVFKSEGLSIQQAAAHATAKAIKELSNE